MNSILTRIPVRRRQREAAKTSVQPLDGMHIANPPLREASTLRILVVDDCPLQQLLSSVLLSRWGVRPQLASDGLEAVLLAGEQRFDLILMDIQMSVLDGVAATTRIRQNERRKGADQAPIVAYTAEPIPANQRAWTEAGINASLAKPCPIAEMGECLQYWCGLRAEPWHH